MNSNHDLTIQDESQVPTTAFFNSSSTNISYTHSAFWLQPAVILDTLFFLAGNI